MKIAYVNNHYQLGGAETVVRQLFQGLRSRGHDTRLHVADGRSWPRIPGLRPMYPRLLARLDHSRAHRWVQRFAHRRRWTDRVFQNLAQSDADIVHVHSFHGHYARMESLAALAVAKPLVWTFHRFWGITGGCDHPFGCERYQTGCGECPQVGRFAIGPVDRTAAEWKRKLAVLSPVPLQIIAPSQHLGARVRASTLGRNWQVHQIPNGVNSAEFSGQRKNENTFRRQLGLHPEKITALITSRDFRDPIKGFGTISEALHEYTSPNLQVVLVGGSAEWARAQLPESLDCVVVGYVADRARLAGYYETADIFLYASDGENFPCATIEAMAAECCVITSPVDGVQEQITSGQHGLVAIEPTGPALAQTLATGLAAGRSQLRSWGRNSRERAIAEFSEEGMLSQHLALYAKLIANSH